MGCDTIHSAEDLGQIPLKRDGERQVLVRDVAEIQPGTMPGQYDRYNMKRQVTLTANRAGDDLGTLTARGRRAPSKRAGDPPKGAKVEVRGQIPPMNEMTQRPVRRPDRLGRRHVPAADRQLPVGAAGAGRRVDACRRWSPACC